MRLVTHEQFLQLPSGVIAQEFNPRVQTAFIKLETSGPDFYRLEIDGVVEAETLESEDRVDLNFDWRGRDGMFDRDQMYAVWEKRDVEKYIGILKDLIISYPENV